MSLKIQLNVTRHEYEKFKNGLAISGYTIVDEHNEVDYKNFYVRDRNGKVNLDYEGNQFRDPATGRWTNIVGVRIPCI